MSFAVAESSFHRSAHTGSDGRIHGIQVYAHVKQVDTF